MPSYSIEARCFRVALAWSHHFWVLRDADLGHSVAELHGLAYDRVTRRILPIGTTKNHSLRVFAYAHDASHASKLALPCQTTRMFARSRARIVYQGADALARWGAALAAMPLLDRLDLTYPPFGFNLLTATVNSNSAYRTFGEIMDVPIPVFPGAFGPGVRDRMLSSSELERAKFRTAVTRASRTS